LLKALKNLGYSFQPGHGDHTNVIFIAQCTDGSDFKFAFPVDRGEIPRGTFHAILDQTGGLSEEQLCQALKGTFTEPDYREWIFRKSRAELLRITRGRHFGF